MANDNPIPNIHPPNPAYSAGLGYCFDGAVMTDPVKRKKAVRRVILNEQDRLMAIKFIQSRPLPCTVTVSDGKPRSPEQNKLMRKWCGELAEQGDQTEEEYRGFIKLHIGVPILRAENEEFRAQYDEVFKPLEYELKLRLMQAPFDFPVTRLMNTAQEKKMLDQVYVEFTGQGYKLTDPADRAAAEYEKWLEEKG